MTVLYLDLETYSTRDLRAVGSYVYATDCELLLFGYAIDDKPVQVWDAYSNPIIPAELDEALSNPDTKLVAHNVGFEWPVLSNLFPEYDWSIERWLDSQVLANTNGLPLDLGTVTAEVNSGTTKMAEGRDLVHLFCKPAPSNHKADRYGPINKPEQWALFKQYCGDDVESMREMCSKLDQRNYRLELENWRLNMNMNLRGLPVDLKTSELMVAAVRDAGTYAASRVSELTEGKVAGPSSLAQMRAWLTAMGYELPSLAAPILETFLARDDLPENVREVATLRQMAGKSSTSKYDAIMRAGSADGHIHGAFQFYGAYRTGRESGRIIQPQNLPRPAFEAEYIEAAIDHMLEGRTLKADHAHKLASSALRSMIWAPDDTVLNVADLSNIEGRMLAWLGGEEWKLEAFREYDAGTGPDLYKMAYGKSFDKEPESVTKDERQIGKVMELALGYQGGVGAFVQFANTFNLDLKTLVEPTMAAAEDYQITKATDMWVWAVEERRTGGLPRDVYIACDILKQGWRKAHPGVVALWYTTQDAAITALNKPDIWFEAGKCRVIYHPDRHQLLVRLPSGRDIVYWKPHYDVDERELTYMGTEQRTRKWMRLNTYGGKLCLAAGTLVLTEEGWVPIEDVSARHRLWDGLKWVDHGGVIYNGLGDTVLIEGVAMTADHEVLTNVGWKEASQSEGYYRAESRLPDSGRVRWERWEEIPVAYKVPMRQSYYDASVRAYQETEAGSDSVLRMQASGDYREQEDHARYVGAPGVRRVAEHVRSLSTAVASGMAELWRQGHHGVRQVAESIRAFLGRHGPDIQGGSHTGSHQQRRALLAGELPLDFIHGASQQQAGVCPGRRENSTPAIRRVGDFEIDHRVSTVTWMPKIAAVRPTGRKEQVYDIMNCGPDNRFVVRDQNGLPLVVHNCENITQAAARDVLFHGAQCATKAGFDIRGTVHDELITLDSCARHHELEAAMAMVPVWAEGLPLAAEGYSSKRYRK